jgi:peptide/nickel transport system substrate-binding protein
MCFLEKEEDEKMKRRKSNYRYLAILLAVLMAVSLAACGGDDSDADNGNDNGNDATQEESPGNDSDSASASGEPKYGGEITVYVQEFYNDYDPSVGDNRNYCLWYESLFSMDWSLENSGDIFLSDYMSMSMMEGQIAESYTFENKDLTVKLREDVHFQNKAPYNGRQVTAADVKWNYDRVLGKGEFEGKPHESEMPYPVFLYMVDGIDTDGDFTVVFHFNTDSERALNDFITTQLSIGGPEWDQLSEEEKADWHNAAGTGPYVLAEYVPDSHMVFEKNPNYYDYDERYPENKLPYIDKLTLQTVQDSTNTVTQFTAGQLDVVAWGGNVLTTTEIEQLKSGMSEDQYKEYMYVGAPRGIGLKQTLEPFKDIRVREALQYAMNSEEISKEYYGYPEDDISIPGLFAFETGYSTREDWDQELYDSYYKYDPEKAKSLLAEAGYADGFEFDVTIFGALDPDLFTLAASYLSKVGVTMNVTVAPSPMEMQQVGLTDANTVSIFSVGGQSRLMQIMGTFQTGGQNDSIFAKDEKFNKMLDDLNTATSMEDAEKLAKEADLYFAQQHWCLVIGGAEHFFTFVNSRIGGYSGERMWKNWNQSYIFPRIWVNS